MRYVPQQHALIVRGQSADSSRTLATRCDVHSCGWAVLPAPTALALPMSGSSVVRPWGVPVGLGVVMANSDEPSAARHPEADRGNSVTSGSCARGSSRLQLDATSFHSKKEDSYESDVVDHRIIRGANLVRCH